MSIPISIVATFILMHTRGVSLNVMSLGGLALGIGLPLGLLAGLGNRRIDRRSGHHPDRRPT